MGRRARIVATLGPASNDEQTVLHLLQAGVDVARLNFSHGTQEDHAAVYKLLREAAKKLGRSVTILQDMQGPKIRTGKLANKAVLLVPDAHLILTTKPLLGNEHMVSVDFPELPDSVKAGGRILLDDGNLELAVTSVEAEQVNTRVVLGGMLKEHKGVNLPGARLDIPGFTEKDEADLAFGLALGVDAIAVSFVRTVKDITQVRQAIARMSPERSKIPVIAKLERPEALDNLEEIVATSDGVMVARGDLGVEMSAEVVPIAQKRIIQAANRHGKVVITATQMLDSMMNNPRPTRAEASDVANAIFDGTDAVMLSGETAAGKYPVQAVEMMHTIVVKAEAHMDEWGNCQAPSLPEHAVDDTFFLTQAARELAHDRNVAAIAVFTKSGHTALMMSKMRPAVPILAFTPEVHTYNRMNLYWSVTPFLVPHAETIEAMLDAVETAMKAAAPVEPGQQVVLIFGYPVHEIRPTNMALLHTVRE